MLSVECMRPGQSACIGPTTDAVALSLGLSQTQITSLYLAGVWDFAHKAPNTNGHCACKAPHDEQQVQNFRIMSCFICKSVLIFY